MDSHVAKGWLLKVGQHRKSWKRRWFVLDLSTSVSTIDTIRKRGCLRGGRVSGDIDIAK